MDSIELVRRVIRKQAAMEKEAANLRPLKKIVPAQPGSTGLKDPSKVDWSDMGRYRTTLPGRKHNIEGLKEWVKGINMPKFKNKQLLDPSKRKYVYGGLGLGALGTGGAYSYFDDDARAGLLAADRLEAEAKALKENPPTQEEIAKAREEAGRAAVAGSPEYSPELLAGAGGAIAGGAAGYALAPTLGISRGMGTLGGGALTALASALLANKLKNSK
jgi:hypothetical protein